MNLYGFDLFLIVAAVVNTAASIFGLRVEARALILIGTLFLIIVYGAALTIANLIGAL